ncbi:ubiquinol:cytochrome c oxidoreductase biogenesis factor, partial [Achlya hypogyna]
MDLNMMQMGMFSTMRANKTEALMCIVLPIVLKHAYDMAATISFDDLPDRMRSLVGLRPRRTVRVITSTQRMGYYGRVFDESDMNHVLQRAIGYYLSAHVKMTDKNSGRYELVEAMDPSVVSRLEEDVANPNEDCYYYRPRDPASDVTILQVQALPPKGEWVEIQPGLWFHHAVHESEARGDGQGNKEFTVTFTLKSSLPDATNHIDTFVNTAFALYQDMTVAKKLRDKSRYMYVASTSASSPSSEDNTAPAAPVFKRYALSDHKTFDSLFFPAKEDVVELLNAFTSKQGKYAIPGFPYKLGFLLHGPPGTGKTSLIKAIAQYTNRHIVNISLANVKTNQDLMDFMLDLRMTIAGEDLPVKLNYDKVVFVMEDIDCASDVVHARKSPAEAAKEVAETEALLDALLSQDVPVKSDVKLPSMPKTKYTPHDKLNLSGLLNVLDGVVDTPGRILIMTSNHPEKLDPALVRPGRIDEKLLLGGMDADQTKLMVQHYFSCVLSAAEAARIDAVFAATSNDISPAQVENLCAKHRRLQDMLAALEAH